MSNGDSNPGKDGLQSAGEVLKVTLTLATGALVFGAGLVKDYATFPGFSYVTVLLAWVLLGLSAGAGILALSAVPMMLSKSNYDLEDPYLTWPARVHQLAFAIGILLLGISLARAIRSRPIAEISSKTLPAVTQTTTSPNPILPTGAPSTSTTTPRTATTR
jgi:hypothetical protein